MKTGSIGIYINMSEVNPYIELDYKYGDEPRKYRIDFVSIPSNLGKGKVWYFLCPETFKRCRILYSVGGYFLHGEAFRGCFYFSQTRSKHYRDIERQYGPMFETERIYNKIYKKHFKKFYAGKPTKKYRKYMEILRKAKSIDIREFERAMVR